MAKAKGQMTEIEALKSELVELRERVVRLETHPHLNPLPDCEVRYADEATDDDLIYTLRVHGEEAYRKALKIRNRQRQARDKHNALLGNLPLQKGGERSMKGGKPHGKGNL